jgi:hypothetical protein
LIDWLIDWLIFNIVVKKGEQYYSYIHDDDMFAQHTSTSGMEMVNRRKLKLPQVKRYFGSNCGVLLTTKITTQSWEAITCIRRCCKLSFTWKESIILLICINHLRLVRKSSCVYDSSLRRGCSSRQSN